MAEVTNASGTRRARVGSVAIGVAILLAAAATWNAPSVVFGATTTNGADSFATGSVVLTDNDSGGALLIVTGLRPGSTGQSCVTVTYGGSLAAGVRLYGTAAAATNALDGQVNLQVEESTASASYGASCAGFSSPITLDNGTLSTFASTYTQYSTGLSTWAPTGAGQVRTYRFTYVLSAGAPSSVANGSASITLTWEANNT